MTIVDNRRIAKNTAMLYIRMLLLMGVTIYTSRVILAVLGVDDYGIYNLVGGFITLFSIISGSLVTALQRYFNAALGANDAKKYQEIYSMGINIFVLFSLFLLIIGETVGLWFINSQLNLPEGRQTAAMWVYQISILTFIVSLFRSADNASIIAYEKMNFYAYISIGEALIKLGIVFLLVKIHADKLVLYSVLYFFTTAIINVAYKIYCTKNFDTCHYHFLWNAKLFRELLSFSGWSLLSRGMMVTKAQGDNYFTNIYYSVDINASRGIAAQVYNAINSFLVNFQTAFNPQLVKSYVAGEMEDHYNLLYRASKFSFFLLLLFVIPITCNMDVLLQTWLTVVPPYTKEFCIYILIAYLLDALGGPLCISIYANSNIKGLMISSSIAFFIGLCLSFVTLKLGVIPYITAIITIFVHGAVLLLYLYYGRKLCGVKVGYFLKKVIVPSLLVSVVSIILPFLLCRYSTGFWNSVLIIIIDVVWVGASIGILGLNKDERNLLISRFIRNR